MRNIHHRLSAIARLLCGAGFYAAVGGTAMASQLIYTPVNPTFGGNPLAGSFLMGIAQQQASENAPGANLASLDLSGLSQSMQDLTNAIDSLNTKVNVGTTSAPTPAPGTKSLSLGAGDEASQILSPGLTGMGSYEPAVSGVK